MMPTHLSAGADLERVLLTAEDFLEWLDPEVSADLIDGEIFMHSPVSIRHAKLLNFLDRLLGTYVDEHGLGQLFREEVAVRLSWPTDSTAVTASCWWSTPRERPGSSLAWCRDSSFSGSGWTRNVRPPSWSRSPGSMPRLRRRTRHVSHGDRELSDHHGIVAELTAQG